MDGYTIEDDGKGNIRLRCEHGEEYTRTSAIGMFCDKQDCTCEFLTREMMADIGQFMKQLGFSETPPAAGWR
jgi:hypothetical protein